MCSCKKCIFIFFSGFFPGVVLQKKLDLRRARFFLSVGRWARAHSDGEFLTIRAEFGALVAHIFKKNALCRIQYSYIHKLRGTSYHDRYLSHTDYPPGKESPAYRPANSWNRYFFPGSKFPVSPLFLAVSESFEFREFSWTLIYSKGPNVHGKSHSFACFLPAFQPRSIS